MRPKLQNNPIHLQKSTPHLVARGATSEQIRSDSDKAKIITLPGENPSVDLAQP